MSAARKFTAYWLPSLIWMVVIFSASADKHSYQRSSTLFVPFFHWLFPSLSALQIDNLHHLARKGAHLTEYAILALLVRNTFRHGFPKAISANSWGLTGAVVAFVFLYASTDEFHQSFVPGRTSLFSDVLIDTAGGTAGLMVLWLCQRVRKKT